MAQDSDKATTPLDCDKVTSASDLLKCVTIEINDFETKKLAQLKTDLEGFVKKQDSLVADYEKQYARLTNLWNEQQASVKSLAAKLTCQFPPDKDPWKGYIAECICKKRQAVVDLAKSIATRQACCQGPLEGARDAAKTAFDSAKADLDILLALVQKLDASLGDDDKLIKAINGLSTEDGLVGLHSFWFRLLPAHTRLAPKGGETVGADDTAEKLCASGATAAASDSGGAAADKALARSLPWLLAPADYGSMLDAAWMALNRTKKAYGKAEAAYKDNPDDLDSLEAKLETDKKNLDGEIETCLKKQKPCEDATKGSKGA